MCTGNTTAVESRRVYSLLLQVILPGTSSFSSIAESAMFQLLASASRKDTKEKHQPRLQDSL